MYVYEQVNNFTNIAQTQDLLTRDYYFKIRVPFEEINNFDDRPQHIVGFSIIVEEEDVEEFEI